jgi:signal transduction histidine kinase
MASEADPSSGADTRARARIEAALDERRRSFLRMVSHELRTPLNSILGFSEILTAELYGPLGAPQYKEYAAIIHGSGQKLLKLVNQVLEIARLEGNTIDFDAGPESLEAALDDVLVGLKPELAARNVRVAVEGRGDLPAVTADGRGLRSVLTQLIHNAVVFSPEGGEVTVSAAARGGFVDIVICDHGEGVDPDELARLMAPFEQGENALTRKAEGAGLGLPIADLTCLAMGGRLKLASTPGQGLTATARLPAAG